MSEIAKRLEEYGLSLTSEEAALEWKKLVKGEEGLAEMEAALKIVFKGILGQEERFRMINPQKFIEQFNLGQLIKPAALPLFEEMLMGYDPEKDCLDNFKTTQDFSKLKEKMDEEDYNQLLATVYPEYKFIKKFNPEEAREKAEGSLEDEFNRITGYLRGVDLTPLKQELLKAEIQEEKKRLERLERALEKMWR